MPPRDVSNVEDRRSIRRAVIQHVEHRVKISIEIDGRPDKPLENERVVPVIPPSMDRTGLEDRRLPAPAGYLAPLDRGGQSAGDHPDFFGLPVVEMQRRSCPPWRQLSAKRQALLAITHHTPNFDPLACMTVLESEDTGCFTHHSDLLRA